MEIFHIIHRASQSIQTIHLSIILILYFLTWTYVLRGKFLIDDHEGVERFFDKWAIQKDPAGVIIKEEKIDWYEENGKKWKNFEFNPSIGFYPGLLRFIRTNFGKKFSVIGKNSKNHEVYGYIQDPSKHHLLSLLTHFLGVILCYFFLSKLIGENLAFNTILLFIVHPVTCQAAAWISGFGYLVSFLFSIITPYFSLYFNNDLGIIPIAISNFISTSALLSGFANTVVLAFLGKWYCFFVSLLISIYLLMTKGKSVVVTRKAAFAAQNMEKSTKLNFRKPIIIIKTFYYYIKMIIFPKRLGLFHIFGYHYDDLVEEMDGMFWKGLVVIGLLVYLFIVSSFPVRFGVMWLFSYLILFSNIITAQQFVADRYAHISSLGYCIILAYFLGGHPIFYFIMGLYMMRTLVHLPTFKSDKHLYESNIFNFPNSEVAYGNLGVILNSLGRSNGAVDSWQEASRMNDLYDVPHYNLYSIMKASGQFDQARAELQKCLNSKTVHFHEMWQKEMIALDLFLSKKKIFDNLNNLLNKAVAENKFDDIVKLKEQIETFQKEQVSSPPEIVPPK